MKLLFDENLSPKLVLRLADLFPGSAHVHDLNLGSAEDSEVWEQALADDYTIVSKDSDYYDLGLFRGHPPKVIWLQLGNRSTGSMHDCLRQHHAAILDFVADPTEAVLLLP